MDLGMEERIEGHANVDIVDIQQQQQHVAQPGENEKADTELNQQQSEMKSSLDLLACRSDDISVNLLDIMSRIQRDVSVKDKEYMCTVASDVRAHFQKTLECSRSLFQSNVRCFLHIIELQKQHEEYEREKDEELLRMQGRLDGLMDILEEKQKENQTLREGVELKALWSKLLQPFGKSPSRILSEYDHNDSVNVASTGNPSFSTALAWISAACAGRVLADPSHQDTQVTDYIAQLIPEIRRCHQVACENHEEIEEQNKNLRNVLAKKSAMYSMAQEQCINAHMKIEHILMELEDTQAQAFQHLEKISQYNEDIANLNENLKHAHRSRDAYRELSDRLGSRLQVSENLIKQYEYDINKEFGTSNGEVEDGEEEFYEVVFEDEEDASTTVLGTSTATGEQASSCVAQSVPSVGAFDNLLIATSPVSGVHSRKNALVSSRKSASVSSIVEGKGIDGSFNNGKDVYSITSNMKDRKLSFSSTNISSPPLPPPPSSSSLSTATKMSQVAEVELNASVISMNESVNSINMSSVPIRRVVKSQMRCRSDSLKHLTIPLGRDMDVLKTPLNNPTAKKSQAKSQPQPQSVFISKENISDEQYKKELESELAYLQLKSPELHKEIATVLKDVISPQTIAFDFSPIQLGDTAQSNPVTKTSISGELDSSIKDVGDENGRKATSIKMFNTPRQV